MRRSRIFTLTLLFSYCEASASSAFPVPDYLVFQSRAYVGWAALGVGYSFWDKKLDVGLMYGYVPKSLGGHKIHSLTLKNSISAPTLSWRDLSLRTASFGISSIYSPDQALFFFSPSQYPIRNYYPPTAVRHAFWLGTDIRWRGNPKNPGIGLFVEFAVLDADLISYFDNYPLFHISQFVSSGVGIVLDF